MGNVQAEHASILAAAVHANYRYGAIPSLALTPLKSQKLYFFAAGVAWAYGVGQEFEAVEFEAWKHGPVVRSLYPSPTFESGLEAKLGPSTLACIRDALDVYGLISAWGLREQSHLEAPWVNAHALDKPSAPAVKIPNETIRDHFRAKFAAGVTFPEHLADRGIFTLDGLHFAPKFPHFGELASYIRSLSSTPAA